jgi:hypothetical protein
LRSGPSSGCVRPPEVEEAGLDDADHGEAGYHGDESGRGGLEPSGLEGIVASSIQPVEGTTFSPG